jgi:hypothetical protein
MPLPNQTRSSLRKRPHLSDAAWQTPPGSQLPRFECVPCGNLVTFPGHCGIWDRIETLATASRTAARAVGPAVAGEVIAATERSRASERIGLDQQGGNSSRRGGSQPSRSPASFGIGHRQRETM